MSDELLDLHLAHMRAGGKSPQTIDGRRIVLRQLYKVLPFGLAYAAQEQIEAWLASLRERGRSRWTLVSYSYHVREFYRWATRAGFLDGDPTGGLARVRVPPSIPRPVAEDQLAHALATLTEPYKTAIVLAAFAGLRRAEIASCRREHITAEAVLIPHGKGDKPGSVPTHPYLWEHIHARPAGPLVRDRGGREVSPRWLSIEIRAALDAIGLDGVHLHCFRHRYGTLIQQSTGDIRVTQECLRHANIRTTMGYTLVTSSQRSAAVAALPVPGAAPAS